MPDAISRFKSVRRPLGRRPGRRSPDSPAVAGGCASDQSTIKKAAAANEQLQPAIVTDAGAGRRTCSRSATASSPRPSGTTPAGARGRARTRRATTPGCSPANMKFHLVNSKTVNAFTTGGEHMYVYTALFQMCQSEDELAAVMSHEFAHVYSRHVQKGTDRQTGMTVLGYGAAGAGYVAGGSQNGPATPTRPRRGRRAMAPVRRPQLHPRGRGPGRRVGVQVLRPCRLGPGPLQGLLPADDRRRVRDQERRTRATTRRSRAGSRSGDEECRRVGRRPPGRGRARAADRRRRPGSRRSSSRRPPSAAALPDDSPDEEGPAAAGVVQQLRRPGRPAGAGGGEAAAGREVSVRSPLRRFRGTGPDREAF